MVISGPLWVTYLLYAEPWLFTQMQCENALTEYIHRKGTKNISEDEKVKGIFNPSLTQSLLCKKQADVMTLFLSKENGLVS